MRRHIRKMQIGLDAQKAPTKNLQAWEDHNSRPKDDIYKIT